MAKIFHQSIVPVFHVWSLDILHATHIPHVYLLRTLYGLISVYSSYVSIQVELEAGTVWAIRALELSLSSVGQHVVS